MKYAVQSVYVADDEEPLPEGVKVGDMEDEAEFFNIEAAQEWAWQRMEEGFGVRLWRR